MTDFSLFRHSRSRSPIDRRPMISRPPPRFDERRDRPYGSASRRDRTPPKFDDRRPPPRIDDRHNDRNLPKNDMRSNRGRNDRPGGVL